MNLRELMHQAFPGGGAPSLQCQCGRSHHAEAEASAADLAQWGADPRIVIHRGCDAVSCCMVAGQVLVDGCPCGSIERMASLLLAEREGVLRLYQLELEQRRSAVSADSAALALAGAA